MTLHPINTVLGDICDCGESAEKSSHVCDICGKHMHGFCGTAIGPEGFDQQRRCKSCSEGEFLILFYF